MYVNANVSVIKIFVNFINRQKNIIMIQYVYKFFCLRDGTVDILVLGTSAERRAGSNPAEGSFISN
jgi:hypothetical protein